jgi:DNA recombination protein RmuC
MNSELLIIIFVMIAGFAVLYWLVRQAVSKQQSTLELEKIVNQVFGMSAQKIAEQSKQILSGEKEAIQVDLENKQRAIERLVKELQLDLKSRQEEIRTLEQDRTQKFTELVGHLQEQRKVTDQLTVTTQQLASVLSNNQSRGGWGERIIEDLLQANGLVEGVHYLRQARQTDSTQRPDITLLLPNNRNVPVDVKFPYAEIQKVAEAETKSAKEVHLKQFAVDVKIKVNKVAEYIDSSKNTLDYAILFVPNEMIFSFLNQKFPEIVDEAINKKVLIVSPFTFLIVARTVMESYRNFMIGDKLKEVVKYIDEFVKEWSVFKNKFEKYGRSIDTLKVDYEELSGTRVRQMERKIEKIETYRQGSLLKNSSKEELLEE